MPANDRPNLKQIPVDQVRLGMHLHALDGKWLDHPFWKSRFVLQDLADLQLLRNSRVPTVWIDTVLGLDVASPADGRPCVRPARARQGDRPAAANELDMRPPDARRGLATAEAPVRPARTAMAEELLQAARLCKQSREVVSALFSQARLGRALEIDQCLPLVDEITASVFRNPGAMVSLARLKTQDDYSYMHSVAVCALMVALSQELGLDTEACREAGLAGLLHDLGKVAVPLDILNKPGKLSADEFDIVRTHPERGYEMLQEARGTPESVMDVCLHHHERFDGRGYPHGLNGQSASLTTLARMGTVCDVYDAISSNRPYKTGWDPAESIARMASWKGQFDESIFRSFARSLGIYPNGALVRLKSGRLALVVEQNPLLLTSPTVKVFFDTRTEMPIGPVLLDLSRGGSGDRIVDREPLERWNFPHLNQLWAGEGVLLAKG